MTSIDNTLQRWRINKAAQHIAPGARVLDIGSGDGALFKVLGDRLGSGLGVDPTLKADEDLGCIQLKAGPFPEAVPAGCEPFDSSPCSPCWSIFPTKPMPVLSENCAKFLKPKGKSSSPCPPPWWIIFSWS